jgi:hypothetical protein
MPNLARPIFAAPFGRLADTQCARVHFAPQDVDVRCKFAANRPPYTAEIRRNPSVARLNLCSGRRGRRFESSHSDQCFQQLNPPLYSDLGFKRSCCGYESTGFQHNHAPPMG